jgi:hypothetical protein
VAEAGNALIAFFQFGFGALQQVVDRVALAVEGQAGSDLDCDVLALPGNLVCGRLPG